MVLSMSRPTRRNGSSILAFRKRIPADLRDKVSAQSVRVHFPVSTAVGIQATAAE